MSVDLLRLPLVPDLQHKTGLGKDMVFRVSGGLYHQPPFYRELRDAAVVQPNVKAQQSVHFVLNDYSFKMWDRPKLVSGCIINLLQM
jgi:hypothetical protein